MKAPIVGILTLGLLTGCGRTVSFSIDHPHEWVLESYDAERGYVFVKDGVTYEAHCAGFMSAEEIQSPPKGFTDIRPIGAAHEERMCSDVLPYLHKPVPLQQEDPFEGDVLFFAKAKDGSFKDGVLEFVVTKAK